MATNGKKCFYITGLPGTGKTTVIKELQKRGIISFDMDEVAGLCHWRHKKTFERVDYHSGAGKEWLDCHEWVGDVVKLKEIIAARREPVVIGGFISNQNEYLSLFDEVFLLQCSQDTMISRLKARIGKDEYGKTEIEREMILRDRREFERDSIERGAIVINTEESIDRAIKKIISTVWGDRF
jgi:dephospho-CoA kinase